jgi:nitroreductase
MATLEEAIIKRMNAYAGLVSLVSTRVYPGAVPEDIERPAISYQKVSSQPLLTHSGPTGWARSSMQFTIAADDYSGKKAVAEQVRKCWDGYAGTIALSTADSLAIGLARIDDRSDVDEAQVTAALGERIDVTFIHAEA